MIPFLKAFTMESRCKPRASGDDPSDTFFIKRATK